MTPVPPFPSHAGVPSAALGGFAARFATSTRTSAAVDDFARELRGLVAHEIGEQGTNESRRAAVLTDNSLEFFEVTFFDFDGQNDSFVTHKAHLDRPIEQVYNQCIYADYQ